MLQLLRQKNLLVLITLKEIRKRREKLLVNIETTSFRYKKDWIFWNLLCLKSSSKCWAPWNFWTNVHWWTCRKYIQWLNGRCRLSCWPDMMMDDEFHGVERKRLKKWSKKMWLHLINTCIFNAQILHKTQGGNLSPLELRSRLIS